MASPRLSDRPTGDTALPLTVLLGMAHLTVDGACGAAVLGSLAVGAAPLADAWWLVGTYNLLAFGLQPLLGWLTDRCRLWRRAAAIGCLLTAAGALCWRSCPQAAVAMCGLGNALFHVGAGGIVMRLSPRAVLPGLFVGPGDLGVALGLCVLHGWWPPSPPSLALACLAATVPILASDPTPQPSAGRLTPGALPVGLLLGLAVLARPLVGSWAAAGHNSGAMVIVLLCVACAAKCFGGYAADRWGWRRVAVGASLAALPWLLCGPAGPAAAVLLTGLVQLPMPMTLAALCRHLPGRPGLAFGLTAACVYLGSPPLGRWLVPVGGVTSAFLVQAACVAVLWVGLSVRPNETSARTPAPPRQSSAPAPSPRCR